MNIKIIKFKAIFAITLIGFCFLGITIPNTSIADSASPVISYAVKKTIKVVVTAYSSTPDQTDDTPFIAANGKHVEDGMIANNMLPFGTKVRIPSLYGNKIFTIGDRMASYKSNYHIDIWMPDRPTAIKFGVKSAEIEVLES